MNQPTSRGLLLIAAAWLAVSSFDATAQTPTPAAAKMPEMTPDMAAKQQKVDEKLQTPFDFYGKVVDENGQAVAGATANVTVMGEVGRAEGETKHAIESDASGMFSLKGIRAFGVIVTVSKKGYQALPDNHVGAYQPGKDLPDANSPAIFALRQKHAGGSLIAIKGKSASFPNDGTPVTIDLKKEHKTNGTADSLEVQAWVDGHDPKSNQPFHWKFRITIPGGGLQPVANDYNFTAPTSGYQPSDEVDMAPSDPKWNSNCERKYFVKLADGSYGRIKLFITPSGDHFFRVEGALNPSGSQNLE